MSTPPDIAITPEQWEIVAAILDRHVPDKAVWAFGSRATRTAKPYSDLDLAIIGESALPLSLLAALEHDFTESDLPFKVDLVDWTSTSPTFRTIIESHRVVLR